MAVLVLAVQTVYHALFVLDTNINYRKDLLQEYVMAKAVVAGENPYQPVSVLVKKYLVLPEDAANVFPHPSPHPPSLLPLILPFGFLDYYTLVAFWLFLSLAALVGSAIVLSRIGSTAGGRLHAGAAIFCLLLSSSSVYSDLVLGQLNTFLLLLLLGCLTALKNEKETRAGLCLGLSFAIKFWGFPLLVFLFLRRRYVSFAVSIGVFVGLLGIGSVLIGLGPVIDYGSRVIPDTMKLYQSEGYNISLGTVGQRIFIGLSPSVLRSITVPPLIDFPELARPVSLFLWAAVFVLGIMCALRQRQVEYSIAYLAATSALLSPVSWIHGLLLFAPLLVLGYRDRNKLFPTPQLRAIGVFLGACLWNLYALITSFPFEQKFVSAWYQPLLAAPTIVALLLLVLFALRMWSQETPAISP